jgi:hypothetical protein
MHYRYYSKISSLTLDPRYTARLAPSSASRLIHQSISLRCHSRPAIPREVFFGDRESIHQLMRVAHTTYLYFLSAKR